MKNETKALKVTSKKLFNILIENGEGWHICDIKYSPNNPNFKTFYFEYSDKANSIIDDFINEHHDKWSEKRERRKNRENAESDFSKELSETMKQILFQMKQCNYNNMISSLYNTPVPSIEQGTEPIQEVKEAEKNEDKGEQSND
ncbi:DUF5659 domain-containing protein [Caproiciproducens sp.]